MSAKPTPPTHLPDPDNLRDVFAYWVRLKRVEKGWSQERLALECELDRTYVSAVERSRWNVSLANIDRIAQALDVKAWTLITITLIPASEEKLSKGGRFLELYMKNLAFLW